MRVCHCAKHRSRMQSAVRYTIAFTTVIITVACCLSSAVRCGERCTSARALRKVCPVSARLFVCRFSSNFACAVHTEESILSTHTHTPNLLCLTCTLWKRPPAPPHMNGRCYSMHADRVQAPIYTSYTGSSGGCGVGPRGSRTPALVGCLVGFGGGCG